jgi:predicted nucleic acid-binding protein
MTGGNLKRALRIFEMRLSIASTPTRFYLEKSFRNSVNKWKMLIITLVQIELRVEMEKISFDPMKFGSENDLKVALTELRLMAKSNGHISENDFLSVSQKYLFPIDFLKKGLEGFSYPEDWLISKSKWFAVLYSWIVKDKERSLDLFRLQFAYIRAGYIAMSVITVLFMALIYTDFTLPLFFHIDMLQRLLGEIFPFVLSIVALGIGLGISLNDKKTKIAEYSQQLREAGLGYIIESNEQLISKNYRRIVHAGSILLRKLEEPNVMTVIEIRTDEKEKPPSRWTVLLCRLHLLPKSFALIKKEKIPVFYGENPYIEYQRRIEELLVTGIMLDTNIFNKVLDGQVGVDIFSKCSIYITHVQHDELEATKKDLRRKQLLEIFNLIEKKKIPTESGIFGVSRFDEAKFSDGKLYEQIKKKLDAVKKKPNNIQDALIAETAIEKSLILITTDRALQEIVCKLNGKAMSLSEFCSKHG